MFIFPIHWTGRLPDMKRSESFPLLIVILLLSACVSAPPQQDSVRSPTGVPQKQPRQTSATTTEKRTVIPDVNTPGHRGDIARKILARSSEQFLNADTNRDYLISVDEAGQHLPHVSREFSRYDRNQDGSLTWQELLGHDEWPSPRHP